MDKTEVFDGKHDVTEPNDKNTLYQSPLGFSQEKQDYLKIIIDGNKWRDDNYVTGLLERVYDDQQIIIKRLEKGLWEIMDMQKSPKIRDKIFEIMKKENSDDANTK